MKLDVFFNAFIGSRLFTGGVATTECNNSTCINGDCVLEPSDSEEVYSCQ